MDDLISRQAVIDALEDAGIINYQATGDFHGIISALTVIKNLPAAGKKGKWIDYCGGVKCDQCGFECDDTYYLGEANFCPNC